MTETVVPAGIDHADDFRARYDRAIANDRLSQNIGRFQKSWRANRDAAVDEIEFEELRSQFTSTKKHVINELDQFLQQFIASAERSGSIVHVAGDARDAVSIVRSICEANGAMSIAKSKSMVSEEIDLNHVLPDFGIEVIETDVGEWIVQQGHERPSHIVGPALHMGREEVGTLLNSVLDGDVPTNQIPEQVKAIRNAVRPAFFEAGVGLTGANALIAESGTTMIVTNEGNGRLASSVPPVQIVLAGIEKLIPTFDDAVTQLRLLARSSTGQRMTVYTTFMTGPIDGHEMHVILVDNGRRAMRAMPEFRDALHCIRCGACSNVCPPYGEVSGHVFGHIYSGAIGLVVSGFHHGLDSIAKAQSLCLSCNACEVVCPLGIPLPQQILDVRKMVVDEQGLPRQKKAALEIYSRPRAFGLANRAGGLTKSIVERTGVNKSKHLPVLNQQSSWRAMPVPARKPLHHLVPSGSFEERRPPVVPNGAAGLSVALFPGCMTDRLYPEQGLAIATVLRHLGARVIYPDGLNCCGLPASNMGDEPTAKKMARHTIEQLERALDRMPADYLISGSASCVAMLVQDYPHLFRDEESWKVRAEQLSARMLDFTTFLEKVAQLPTGILAGAESPVVTYHDSCQGMNALNLHAEPRRLLVEVLGYELREIDDIPMCCGFGGSFSFDYPEIAKRLMDRKLDAAEATCAPVLVTDNQGCIMHLRGGCDAEGRPIEVRHIAELVAERLDEIDAAMN